MVKLLVPIINGTSINVTYINYLDDHYNSVIYKYLVKFAWSSIFISVV